MEENIDDCEEDEVVGCWVCGSSFLDCSMRRVWGVDFVGSGFGFAKYSMFRRHRMTQGRRHLDDHQFEARAQPPPAFSTASKRVLQGYPLGPYSRT